VRADSDATSSDLSDVLGYAMEKVREECGPCTVAFLGSDAPELPLSAMQAAFQATALEDETAVIYPANDGGYTALVLPPAAQPSYCFANVHWSSHDTCISQLAALSRAGLRCVVGQTYDDVDELEDLVALDLRLQMDEGMSCPYMSTYFDELRATRHWWRAHADQNDAGEMEVQADESEQMAI